MGFKALCDGGGVLADSWHTHVQCSHTALKKVASVRVRTAAKVCFPLENLRDQLLGTNHRTADDIGMATEVFGGGVNHQIDPHGEGLTAPRRGEGVVDDDEKVVALGHVHHRSDVAHFEHGVGQGLDVEHLGVGLNRRFIGGRIAHVGHRG